MLFAAIFLLVQSHSGQPFAVQLLRSLIFVNLSLVIFNIVPFMGTDSYFILSTLFKVPNVRTNAYTEFKRWIGRKEHKFTGVLIFYFVFSFALVLYFFYRMLVRLYVTAVSVGSEGLHVATLYRAWPFGLIFFSFIARRLWDYRDKRNKEPEDPGRGSQPDTPPLGGATS